MTDSDHIVRCPTCKEPLTELDPKLNRALPFCSIRCQQVDLSKWLDGEFAIPGQLIARDMPLADEDDAHDD